MYRIEGKRIWVAGHNGMVGRAVVRALERRDCTILTASRGEADLTRQTEVEAWMAGAKPDAGGDLCHPEDCHGGGQY